MTKKLGFTSWATGALVLAATAACGSSPGDPPSAAPISAPRSVATSISPTAPSDIAASDATALLHRYFRVIDQLSQRPTLGLANLRSVAVGTELNAEQHFLSGQHQRGEKQVGSTRIAKLVVQSVNLDNTDPAAGKLPTVTIDACWDVSHADVVDRNGKSIVSLSRPDTGWTRYTIANYRYAAHPGRGWRVKSAQDLKQTPCAGS